MKWCEKWNDVKIKLSLCNNKTKENSEKNVKCGTIINKLNGYYDGYYGHNYGNCYLATTLEFV